MSVRAAAIAYYLERYRQGHGDDAFHGLLELEHAVVPELAEAFHASTDTPERVLLLKVIWQHRQHSTIPLLAKALLNGEPEVWQEAMDGLVALASPDSLAALRRARSRPFIDERERQQFSQWLQEAIEQAEMRL
jgi:hypothetical protein